MPSLPATRYAKSGEIHIAYQVSGEGPLDLVVVPGWVSHLEYQWEEPWGARFFQRLASFSRLIRFDKRGTGLSDRVSEMPTLEQRMDDVRAVMDAVGSERAALFGYSEGGPMSILFAAAYPERTPRARSLRVVCEVRLGPGLPTRALRGAAVRVSRDHRAGVGWTRFYRGVYR
jgi:pimeloyl-ACP methyl ester carboxylesterase